MKPSTPSPVNESEERLSSLVSAAQAALECPLCLSLICEPVSLPLCGHSFCRLCLVKALRRHKKRCPSCRAVCHISPESAAENVMLKALSTLLDENTYRAKLEELQAERASWAAQLPIFYYNAPIFPRNALSLHLFEPRYRLMMQRVTQSTNTFAYVPNFVNYSASIGDIALVAKVVEAEFLHDGRCLLEATIVSRNKIVDHFVEDGTQGLHFCRVEPLKDDAIDATQQEEVKALVEKARGLISRVLESTGARREIERQYGTLPPAHTDVESFSLWLASVSPLSDREKMSLLSSTHTQERIAACAAAMEAYLQRFSLPRFASAVREVVQSFLAGNGNDDTNNNENDNNNDNANNSENNNNNNNNDDNEDAHESSQEMQQDSEEEEEEEEDAEEDSHYHDTHDGEYDNDNEDESRSQEDTDDAHSF